MASTDQYRQSTLPPPPPPIHQAQPYNHQQPYQYQQYQPDQQYRSYHQQSPSLSQQPQQPQQQQPPQQRQQNFYPPPAAQKRPTTQNTESHKSRTFSFHSQKSHKTSSSKDLTETPAEKYSKRLHSKADPTLAISEAEPAEIAAMMTETSIAPLRSIQHKDANGNAISDPDKSNPTRNRWERPLDTIRSFEAAIDGGYSRKSIYRTETDSLAQWNRRNSSYVATHPRFPRDSYYNNRPVSFKPERPQFDQGAPRTSYFDGHAYNNAGHGPGPSNKQRMSRTYTEPQYQVYGRDQNIYPMPHKDRSYETVTSAAGSGHSDQAGYQTDPTSSDNSSIERASAPKRREPVNDYGISFSQPHHDSQGLAPTIEQPQEGPAPPQKAPGLVPQQPPAPAQRQKHTIVRRQPSNPPPAQQQRVAAPEKRKGWLSRRFSKNS